MGEKPPTTEPKMENEQPDQEKTIREIAKLLGKIVGSETDALSMIADEIKDAEDQRRALALERGLPEDAAWDDIIAYDKRQGKN